MANSFFNSLDYFYIILVLSSCLVGFFRGFVKDFFSTCSWLGSGFIAAFISPYLANYLQVKKMISNPLFAKIVAILASFVVILITLLLVVNMMSKKVKGTTISGVDRAFGALYGFARGFVVLLIVCCCVIIFNLLDLSRGFIANSKITPILISWSDYLLPKIVNTPKIQKKNPLPKSKNESAFSEQEMRRLAKSLIKKDKEAEETKPEPKKEIRSYVNELISKFTGGESSSQDVPRKAPGTESLGQRAKIKNKEDNVPFGCMDLMKARAKRRAQKKAKRIQAELMKKLDK